MADMVITRGSDGETVEITYDPETRTYEAVQTDSQGNVDTRSDFGDAHTWLDLARIYADDGDSIELHDEDYGPFDKDSGSGIPDRSASGDWAADHFEDDSRNDDGHLNQDDQQNEDEQQDQNDWDDDNSESRDDRYAEDTGGDDGGDDSGGQVDDDGGGDDGGDDDGGGRDDP